MSQLCNGSRESDRGSMSSALFESACPSLRGLAASLAAQGSDRRTGERQAMSRLTGFAGAPVTHDAQLTDQLLRHAGTRASGWLIPRSCALRWGCEGPSGPRTQGEALAGQQGRARGQRPATAMRAIQSRRTVESPILGWGWGMLGTACLCPSGCALQGVRSSRLPVALAVHESATAPHACSYRPLACALQGDIPVCAPPARVNFRSASMYLSADARLHARMRSLADMPLS